MTPLRSRRTPRPTTGGSRRHSAPRGRWRVVPAAAALLLLGSGLAACGGGAEETPEDTAGSAESPADTSSGTAETTPDDGGQDGNGQDGGQDGNGGEPESTQVFTDMGADFRGILSDVTIEECPTRKGDVEARGSVENTADQAQDIFIGVIWLEPDSGDSVALGEFTAKDVGAGDSVDWSVEASLRSRPGQCVLQAKANDVGTLK